MSIFCPQAQYVLKTDDDIYVNVDLLHRSLLEESKTLSQNIHGKMIASIMANLEMTKNIHLKMRKILPFGYALAMFLSLYVFDRRYEIKQNSF